MWCLEQLTGASGESKERLVFVFIACMFCFGVWAIFVGERNRESAMLFVIGSRITMDVVVYFAYNCFIRTLQFVKSDKQLYSFDFAIISSKRRSSSSLIIEARSLRIAMMMKQLSSSFIENCV